MTLQRYYKNRTYTIAQTLTEYKTGHEIRAKVVERFSNLMEIFQKRLKRLNRLLRFF